MFAFGLLGAAAPAPVRAAGSAADSARVLLSLSGGVQFVDLPRFDRPEETIGARSRVAFDFGVRARNWFEPHAELAFAYLGGSDSLDAVLAGSLVDRASLGTLVQLQAGVRLRWARPGRWQPYAALGAGIARLRIEAGPAGERSDRDALWSAGAGTDLWVHPRVALRAEGLYLGQSARRGTAAHAALQFGLVYGVRAL